MKVRSHQIYHVKGKGIEYLQYIYKIIGSKNMPPDIDTKVHQMVGEVLAMIALANNMEEPYKEN